jgi:hypothetical protein
MGGNARERHGLFRCGAFVATRVRRRPATSNAKSAPHYGQVKRIVECCNNPTGGKPSLAAAFIGDYLK